MTDHTHSEDSCCSGSGHKHHHHGVAGAPASSLVKDPVCGMDVDTRTAKHRAEHEGHPYFFCANTCKTKFEAAPSRYLKSVASKPSADEGAIYTCPMHPEIRQVGPGSCPICGMALEPVAIGTDNRSSPELADMTRRFWIGLALSVPVVALEMGGHLFDLHRLIAPQLSIWLQFALATPVVWWSGWPFFERAWRSVVTRKLNMFTLIAMGTGVAWAYSVIAALVPSVFPEAFRTMDGLVAVYFEAAAVILVLVLPGQYLEFRAREQTSGAPKALPNLAPTTPRRTGSAVRKK